MQKARLTLHQQSLVWQMTVYHYIDSAEQVESVRRSDSYSLVKLDVIIKGKKEAMEEAKKEKSGLVI